jgi:hypothetical protein
MSDCASDGLTHCKLNRLLWCVTSGLLTLVAEVILSAWRITTSFYGTSSSVMPSRIMFRVPPSEWVGLRLHDASPLAVYS